jgi:hypothetical protein
MDITHNEDRLTQMDVAGANYNAVIDILFIEGSSVPTEPVTLAEALVQANIDNIAGDNSLIESYITTARMQCEGYCNIGFINRDIQAVVNNTLGNIYLPYGPVGDVSTVTDMDGNAVDYEVKSVHWKTLHKPQRDNLTVKYNAGYSALPQVFKTALLQQVAYLYEHRGDEKADTFSPIAKSLLNPHRRS